MPLQSSGPISLGQIQSEFGGAAPTSISEYYRGGAYTTTNNTNVPTSGKISLSDFYGAVSEILRYITTTSTNVNASSYFTAAEWASSAPKRLVINGGVTVGATNTSNYALNIPSGFGGTFRLDNNGSILGAGGAANSGTGGSAIFAGAAISINNQGTIYSGGGGGGQGGTGGTGSYTSLGAYQFLGASGWNTFPGYGYGQYGYRCQQTCKVAYSGYANVYASFEGVSNPYRDPVCCVACCFGSCCDCCNSDAQQNAYASCCYGQPYITVSTSGGGGGAGGRGLGYNQSAADGSGGGGGGTNAGGGGTGGNGGTWGASGKDGGVGANGNASSAPLLGTSGGPAYGGLAGFYIVNNSNVTWIANGTRAGRVG